MSGRRATAWILAAAGLACGPAPAQQDAAAPQTTQAATAQPAPALLRQDATPEARRESAASLARAGELEPLRRAILGDAPEGAAEAALAAASEVIRADNAAPALLGLLGEAAASGRDAVSQAAIDALREAGDRDAIRALLRAHAACLGAGHDDRAAAAARAIAALSGRPFGGAATDAWRAWWSDAEWLPETAWQARLTETFRDRWAEEQRERRALEAEAADLYRRLYSRLEPPERAELLDEMLRSDRHAARLAGLRLIEQSLLNGRPVAPELGPTLALALASEAAETRRLAAELALRVAPKAAQREAAAALHAETDARAAAGLMELLLTGAPDAPDAEAAEPWLRRGGPAGDAAARLIATALRAGRSPGETFESRVREAVDARLERSPSAPVVALLGLVAPDAGARAAAILKRADGAVAAECARLVAARPGGIDRLRAIARSRPDARKAVASGLAQAGAGLDAYRLLLRLPGGGTARTRALEGVWRTLTDEEALAAAAETPAPSLRATLLRERLETENDSRTGATRGAMAALLADALALSGDHAAALETLSEARAAIEEANPGAVAAIGAVAIEAALAHAGAPPAPEIAAPEVWAAALQGLAARRPGAARRLAENTELRAHIRTSAEAETALTEGLAAALDAEADAAPSVSADQEPGPDAG